MTILDFFVKKKIKSSTFTELRFEDRQKDLELSH